MFFNSFPDTSYKFDKSGRIFNIENWTRYSTIASEIIDNPTFYSYYQIKEGERPDVVSNNLYGTPEYHWTFFLLNDSLRNGLDGWPLSYSQLENYIQKKFGDLIEFVLDGPIAGKTFIGEGEVVEYRKTSENKIVLANQWESIPSTITSDDDTAFTVQSSISLRFAQYDSELTYADKVRADNESNSRIRVIKASRIREFVDLYQESI